MLKRILSLACLMVAAPAAAAIAQNQAASNWCWLRPGPLDRCRNWLVTEAAVEVPIAGTSHSISAGTSERDFDTRFVLSIGAMRNLDGSRAAGIVLGHDVNRSIDRAPTRVEGRFRQWKGMSAIDVSAGLSRKGIQGAGDVNGFTAALGGEWRYIGADARLELYQANGRTVAAGLLGARATSVAAPIAALAVFGAVAALILSTGAGY